MILRINLTLKRAHLITDDVLSNKHYVLWVCVCSLRYPARKARAPYYTVVCSLAGSNIFFHIIS